MTYDGPTCIFALVIFLPHGVDNRMFSTVSFVIEHSVQRRLDREHGE